MSTITLTDDAGNTADVPLPDNVTLTIAVDTPPPNDPPPDDGNQPDPNAVDVSFTATMSAKGVVVIKDTSANVPAGALGQVRYGDGAGGSIRAGNQASYGYKSQGQNDVSLTWKAPDGLWYTATCPGVTFDGVAHDYVSVPGTAVAPAPTPTRPPSGGNGASAPPTNPNPPQVPPPVPNATGAHVVNVTVDDGAATWSVTAGVGDDYTAMGPYCALRDAAGNVHPGLRARIHADGCIVGALAGGCGQDFAGTLTITHDGVVVFGPEAVQFPRGCANRVIRYGKQAPWHAVDPSLFPHWATPDKPLKLPDLTKYDLSYNGLGVATTVGMADPGARWDICFVPGWTVPFCLQPSDEAFAVVRASADGAGAWAIYFIDDNTGLPFDVTQYPNTSMIGYGTARYPGNPIAQYGDKPAQKITGCPYHWSQAHQTGYCFVAAAATDSALDKWQAACHANAVLVAFNPAYRIQCGIWRHYQQRGSAWALRSLFLASYVSCMPDYFAAQLDTMRTLAPFDNPLGYLADYCRPGANNVKGGPNTGVASFEENYVRTVVNVIAAKLPAWGDFRAHLAQSTAMMGASPQFPLSTIYVTTVKDPSGNWLTSWKDVLTATLHGPDGTPSKGYDPPNDKGAWADEDIAAVTADDVTPDQVYALIQKYTPGYVAGNFLQYATMPDGYPALMGAACAAAMDAGVPDADKAWATWRAVPTKPDFSGNWGWNIVPRQGA